MTKVMTDRDIMISAMNERKTFQKDLAEKMGVNQSTISTNMRRDKIGLNVFAKLLDALGYDVAVVDRNTGKVKWTVEVK